MISRIDIEDMTDAQGPDTAKLQRMRDANWRPAVDYWRERAMKAEADLARPSQAGDETVARLRDVACGATTMIGHALDDGQIDEEVAGNFEALWTDLNAALAAMDTPKGGEDE